MRAEMEQVGTTDGAEWLLGDGEVALDANAAEDVAAGRDGPGLLHAIGRLRAYVDLADGACRVEGVVLRVLIVSGDRGLDGRLEFLHGAGGAGMWRKIRRAGRTGGELLRL